MHYMYELHEISQEKYLKEPRESKLLLCCNFMIAILLELFLHHPNAIQVMPCFILEDATRIGILIQWQKKLERMKMQRILKIEVKV